MKGKVLESIKPEETNLVEINQNSYERSFDLTKKKKEGCMQKLDELIGKKKETESATNITNKKK